MVPDTERRNSLLSSIKNFVNELEGASSNSPAYTIGPRPFGPQGPCCAPTPCSQGMPCGPAPPPMLPLMGPMPKPPCFDCTPPNTVVCYRRPKVKIICGKRPRSREIRGGLMIFGCNCEKRNGLQDQCLRKECLGAPECMTKPFPACGPSMYANAQHFPLRYKGIGIEESICYPAFVRLPACPPTCPGGSSPFGPCCGPGSGSCEPGGPYGPCSPSGPCPPCGPCGPCPSALPSCMLKGPLPDGTPCPACCPLMCPPFCPPGGPACPPSGTPIGPVPCGPCPPCGPGPMTLLPSPMAPNIPMVAPCGPSPPGPCPLCAPCPARPCGPCVGPCVPLLH